MFVLGIDPGTATTGFGLIKIDGQGEIKLVDYGLLETDKSIDPGERLDIIYEGLTEIIKKHQPHILAMEKVFFFSNAKTVIRVSQAQGVVLLAASKLGVPVSEYTPGQVKLVVGGSGRADKKIMQIAIFDMFGLEAEKNKKTHFDNVADAIGIALCHIRTVFPTSGSLVTQGT